MENNLQTICEALSNKKSVLIKVLNVRDLTSIADYFVLDQKSEAVSGCGG